MPNSYRGLPLDKQARKVHPVEPDRFPDGTLMLQWEAEDNDDTEWFPQGITSFQRDEQHLALVSWYQKNTNNVRISFVTRRPDDSGRYWYAHTFLRNEDGHPVRMHAGGLAFRHSQLLIAKTRYGVVSFDATNPRRDGGVFYLNQVGEYELASAIVSCTKRFFSFVDIDWTDDGNITLLSGVWASVKQQRDIVRLPAVFSWKIVDRKPIAEGVVEHLGVQCYDRGGRDYRNMQGVAKYGDAWYYSQTGSVDKIRRKRGDAAFEDIASCSGGLEDLHITSSGRYLLGLTEAPGKRMMFEIDLRNTL